jgi:hypothetical protein
MDETHDLLNSILAFLGVCFVGIIGWFIREDRKEMKANISAHTARLDRFDACAITRDELERRMASLHMSQGEQHRENRELLERIVEKIDRNEERASKTRHDTKDEVHALAMKLAVIAKSQRRTEARDQRDDE